MAKKNTIKCPHCGCEYLPAEIYFPNDFLGYPTNIIKDEKGEILGFNGEDMNTTETFICWNCEKSFSVEAVVTFKTAPYTDIFDDTAEEEFASVLKKKEK